MKPKINKLSLGLCFIWLAFIVSCSKTQDLNETNGSSYCDNSFSNFKLANNPYDYVGELHNGAIDSIVNTPGYPALTPLEKYNIQIAYLTNKLGGGTTFLPFNTTDSIVQAANSFNSLEDLATSMFNQGKISQKERQLLNTLNTIAISSNSVSHLVNRLNEFDNSSIQRNDITENERTLILLTSSILSHSAEYWGTLEGGDGGVGGFPKFLADGIGGVIGGSVGSVFGGVPVGTIIGFVVGAVAGSLGRGE